jgi:hypothetical protein
MAEFVMPGTIGRRAVNLAEGSRAHRIWERATAAARFAPPQPFSTLSGPVKTSDLLAWLLWRAGVPATQAAQFLRVSELGFSASLAIVRNARRDPPVAAWADELAAAMPSFHDAGEVA